MSAQAVSDALNAMLRDEATRAQLQAGDVAGFDLDANERDLIRAAAADCPDAAEVAGFAQVDFFNFGDGSVPFAYQTGGSGHAAFQQAALYCRKAG
jgi:hypothetical protein